MELSTDFLAEDGARRGFVVLAGFLLSFAFIRMSTRLMRSPKVTWWPGSVSAGGVHVHHLVFGIVLLMASGFVNFALDPESPWVEVLAALFGIGVGLTLDEFALWLHLEDVYWSDQGRQSLEAVAIAAVVGGMIVLGAAPFELQDAEGSISILILTALVNVTLVVITVRKGKLTSAVLGAFVPVLAVFTAIRLAKPDSWWARRRYAGDPERMRRARQRGAVWEARRVRWMNRLGGAPSEPDPQPGRTA
jgi:hypothetical protein